MYQRIDTCTVHFLMHAHQLGLAEHVHTLATYMCKHVLQKCPSWSMYTLYIQVNQTLRMTYLFSLTKDNLSLKLRPTQMSMSTIGIVFNVEDVFLVGDDGSVATPDEGGLFNTYDLDTEKTYTVHGTPVTPKSNHSTQAVTKWKPGCSISLVHAQPSIHKKTSFKKVSMPLESLWTKAVEIICGDEASIDAIKKTCNLPIRLTETTANVPKVADIVAGEAFFNGESVVVLDCDNLRIPDTNGTRGTSCKFSVVQ